MTAIRSPWGSGDTQLASELRYAHHELWGEVAMKKLLHRLIYYLRYRRHCSGFCVTCKFYEICKEEINFDPKSVIQLPPMALAVGGSV